MQPLTAADEAQVEEEGPTGPWSYSVSLGAFASNTASNNSAESRDPGISGSEDNYAYRIHVDASAAWSEGNHSVEQLLELRYGRSRNEGESWTEDSDEISYDASYNYALTDPHFIYAGWGADSQFTGPEPDEEPLDPLVAFISSGYGQTYSDLFPDTDKLLWRAGLRVQKRWGRGLSDEEREAQLGPEARIRYERTQFEEQLKWYVQYDIFGDFADLAHISHTFDAGLNLAVTDFISVKLTLKAYYESEPDDADDDSTGYDELSWKQESLVGITYEL